jgi:hypothetical protein
MLQLGCQSDALFWNLTLQEASLQIGIQSCGFVVLCTPGGRDFYRSTELSKTVRDLHQETAKLWLAAHCSSTETFYENCTAYPRHHKQGEL